MKTPEGYERDLAEIRSLMERSVKFISLSGLSGVAAGTYAIVGAALAYYVIYFPQPPIGYAYRHISPQTLTLLLVDAVVVLVLALGTGIWLSSRNARLQRTTIWNPTSKKLFAALAVPLLAGGLFIINLLFQGYFELVAASCLVFYGLALLNGSFYTYNEIRFLGILEISLGLLAAFFPGYGLIAWTVGFGLLHIIYGAMMYNRYER
ncbi:MAG: hypothetical protein AB7K37_06350 [Cyclobacteriaceae bacterium]